MNIEPKMAIACRDKVEIDVALAMIEKAGICWSNGDAATRDRHVGGLDVCRLYISPADELNDYTYLMYNEDPEDVECDDEDGFEWTYLEASDMFKNQIISERRKHATST